MKVPLEALRYDAGLLGLRLDYFPVLSAMPWALSIPDNRIVIMVGAGDEFRRVISVSLGG